MNEILKIILLYFFHISNFYNSSNSFFKYENPLYSHNFVSQHFNFNNIKKKSVKFKNVHCFKSYLKF